MPAAASTTHPGPPPAGLAHSDLLRFAAVGSVDDGKSTLIGRLLFDTRQLFDDQVDALAAAAERRGLGEIDLSFVTDGLRAERSQGITIDVAYRYAATPRRKFVIADCPGHLQYTRNMATGASTADLALVVVDASRGLSEQTRRHICIAALLGVTQIVVAANKMDLVGWEYEPFERLSEELADLAQRLGLQSSWVVPVSALHGDNVVGSSKNAPWYVGPTILELLESLPAGEWARVHGSHRGSAARLPVQWVLRDPRGGRSYAGMVNGGPFRKGDRVVVLPAGLETSIQSIDTFDGPIDVAPVGKSVSLELTDHIDVSRGDLISSLDDPADVTNLIDATLCWFRDVPLRPGERLRIKHTTRLTPAVVETVSHRFDVNTLELRPVDHLSNNEIGTVSVRTADPLAVDSYRHDRITGSFILIDDATNSTVAAGMIGTPGIDRSQLNPN